MTVTVTETKRVQSTYHRQVTASCDTDPYGHTDCTEPPSRGTRIDLIQIAKGSDGNVYELECAGNILRGFGQGMQAASGTVTGGCMVSPGTYSVSHSKRGLKLGFVGKNGKTKNLEFSILSVKKGQ